MNGRQEAQNIFVMAWENTGGALREHAPLQHHGLFKPAELSHPCPDLYPNQQHLKTKKGLMSICGPDTSIISSLLPRYMDKVMFTLSICLTGLNTQHYPGPKTGKKWL